MVAVGQSADGVFQRFQPGLEVAPVIHAFRVNGAAHLLGAQGLRSAAILVKVEACLLEWQSAMLEQAVHLTFRVGHQMLVVDAVHAVRQHRVDVIHELGIVPVVQAHLGQIVGKVQAGAEQLLVAGEAATTGWRRESMMMARGNIS